MIDGGTTTRPNAPTDRRPGEPATIPVRGRRGGPAILHRADGEAGGPAGVAVPTASRLRSAGRSLLRRGAPALFAAVAALPVARRLAHPTLLGDDLARLGDLEMLSFREHLFHPFSEHIAPVFQAVSWTTWNLIGRDLRPAPLAFCVASVLPWALVLGLLFAWLVRETRSRAAAALAVAMVAPSPLVLESVWWYSASSFLWAVAAILVALLGAGVAGRRPRRALATIGAACALGPACTTLGLLAAPLAALRAAVQPDLSRRMKVLVVVAAAAGVLGYERFCRLGEVRIFDAQRLQAKHAIDPIGGIWYAITVPGRILWPSTFGVPASTMAGPMPAAAAVGLGLLAMLGTAAPAIWPRARWDRRLILVGGVMIYLCYTMIFVTRASLLREGWTEAQLLYQITGRYHLLPLLGASAIVAAMAASLPIVRRLDATPGLPAALGLVLGLLLTVVQARESDQWAWMLEQPDQRATLAALHRLGEVAQAEGIPRDQLLRVIDPIWRPWDGSIFGDRPEVSHLALLCAAAPGRSGATLDDREALDRIRSSLTPVERMALGRGACAFGRGDRPGPTAPTLAVARVVGLEEAREVRPGCYRGKHGASFVEFAIDPVPGARFLEVPGLRSDQDLTLSWSCKPGAWPEGQAVHWFAGRGRGGPAVLDLDRLIAWAGRPIVRLRVGYTKEGEIALEAPRLLR